MDEPRRELHLFFASENSQAVILYRAKKNLYRLIGWDTSTDRFSPGQWIKTRVYEHGCALSPDGRHFVYGAMLKGTPDLFVAISRPPFFTALEFFPELTAYDTGGYFLDNKTVTLKLAARDSEEALLDCGLILNKKAKSWLHQLRPRGSGLSKEQRQKLVSEVEVLRGRVPQMLSRFCCADAKLYRKADTGDCLLKDFGDMEFEAIKAPYLGVERGDVS